MSMLVWLILPFYDFVAFDRFIADNSVYKVQFFSFMPFHCSASEGSSKVLPKITHRPQPLPRPGCHLYPIQACCDIYI